MDKKVIIIPTYNEKENIEKMIRALRSLEGDYHILVIDNRCDHCCTCFGRDRFLSVLYGKIRRRLQDQDNGTCASRL